MNVFRKAILAAACAAGGSPGSAGRNARESARSIHGSPKSRGIRTHIVFRGRHAAEHQTTTLEKSGTTP